MEIDLYVILLYVVNVIILYFILRWLLYKPVTKFLEGRERSYADKVAELNQKEADAEVLKHKYEHLINDAQSQAADIINKGNEMARERSKDIVDDAKEQARMIVMRSRSEIESEKKLAKQEMKDEIVEMAIQIAGRVLEREVSEADNKKIIDDFFEKVV